jgi:hypothetical protein
MRKQPNYTCMLKNLLKLYCICSWDTLWVYFCVCVQFCPTLCIHFDETTREQQLRHHLQNWRVKQTPTLLRLKLHCIWTLRVFFYFSFCFILIYIFFLSFTYFLFLFLSSFFLFFIFNPLSLYCLFSLLSLSTLMLPVYIFETFLFHSLFCFFLLVSLFVFPFFFNFLDLHLLSPFHSKYHHCYYYKLENT